MKNNKTQIFINGEQFIQCVFLYLVVPKDKIDEINEIQSIDEAAYKLSNKMEVYERGSIEISEAVNYGLIEPRKSVPIAPEEEFWAHCSNMQAWKENNYDTCLLHSNLSFPVLKRLTEVGDPKAKKVFKEEIAKRFESGYKTTVMYLVNEEYVNYLNNEELEMILENFDFSPYIGKTRETWNKEFTTLFLLAKKSSIAKSVFKEELKRILKEGNPEAFKDYYELFIKNLNREEIFCALLSEQDVEIIMELEALKNTNGQYISKFGVYDDVSGSEILSNAINVRNGKIVGLILKEPKLKCFPLTILKLKELEYLYLSLFEKEEEYKKNFEAIKKKIKNLNNLKVFHFGIFSIKL